MNRISKVGIISMALLPWIAEAGDVESFNERIFDLQYFTRPYERAAVAGGAWEGAEGSAASALQNPAGLADLKQPELLTYWTFNFMKGEGLGVQTILPPEPGQSVPTRIGEKPLSRISDIGAFQAFSIGSIPGSFSAGADYMWNDLSNNDVSQIEQYGFNPGLSWGLPMGENMSIGYGLTYLGDIMQWGVSWPEFTPGVATPQNVNYVLRSTSESWRHRLGLRGKAGAGFRFGIEGELGYGTSDNEWNKVDTGGDDDMRHKGIRAGLEYDFAHQLTLAADLDWHKTLVEYGWHPGAIGGNPAVAKWDTEVVRPMVGLKYALTETCRFMGGYRYSNFKTTDLCYRDADDDYNTFSLGTACALLKKRLDVVWNIEYSTLGPDGELMNLLSASYLF